MNSVSKENYLSIIYKHRDPSGEIKPNVIAEWLQISNPAVTDMLKKLAKDKLVLYTPYKAVRFTKQGELAAKKLVRRHRIWEIFLHEIVGMPWEKVHAEAERLEHHSSDELISRLEEMVNFPAFDPHGDPIPDKNGVMPQQLTLKPLSEMPVNSALTVKRVSGFDGGFLQYINSIGITLQATVTIIEIRGFDKSLLIDINGAKHSISSTIADNIFVSDNSGVS